MGWFVRDPKLALVQTPHHFYSPDPFERNLRTGGAIPNESELFYGLIQRGNDLWNAAFFCGSCAVLRRTRCEEVGGIAVETVTEDAHTALKLHRRGWHTAYLEAAAGGWPGDRDAVRPHRPAHPLGARHGADLPRRQPAPRTRPQPGRSGSATSTRCCTSSSGCRGSCSCSRPSPTSSSGGTSSIALPLAALAYGLPHLVHSTAANARLHGRFRHSFWSEVYETCLAAYISVPTALALIAPRAGGFNVTAKGGRVERAFFDARIARPYLLLLVLNLAALSAGGWKLWTHQGDLDSLVINLGWAFHNLLILSATLAVACERRQLRSSPRVEASLPAMLRFGDGRTVRCETRDLSRGGAQVSLRAPRLLTPRERVWLSVFSFDDEHPLPAEVIAEDRRGVRLRFTALSAEEEAHLVRTIFSRADAWLGWLEGRRRDRPLLTLARIARHGAAGVGRALALGLRPRSAAPRPPAVEPVGSEP